LPQQCLIPSTRADVTSPCIATVQALFWFKAARAAAAALGIAAAVASLAVALTRPLPAAWPLPTGLAAAAAALAFVWRKASDYVQKFYFQVCLLLQLHSSTSSLFRFCSFQLCLISDIFSASLICRMSPS